MALGLENGQIFMMRFSNNETFMMDAHRDAQAMQSAQGLSEWPAELKIVDMQWDP